MNPDLLLVAFLSPTPVIVLADWKITWTHFLSFCTAEYGLVLHCIVKLKPNRCHSCAPLQEVKRQNTNKLASLEATLVRNSAHLLTYLLTGVKCRATSVAKKNPGVDIQGSAVQGKVGAHQPLIHKGAKVMGDPPPCALCSMQPLDA